MNQYITAQCKNMITMVETFEQACKLAALKDDGTISREKEKALRKISKTAEKFKAELSKIR